MTISLSKRAALLSTVVVLTFFGPAVAQDAIDPGASDDSESTATEGRWDGMNDEERTGRRRERTLFRYEPSGQVNVGKLPEYIEKFRRGSVYDERIYRFVARAEHVTGTTGTIILTGEVTSPEYSTGLERTLTTLGFVVQENRIQNLPSQELGNDIYAVATTVSASLRAKAKDSSELVNSVAMGGMLRLLRPARPDDAVTAFVSDARDDNEGRGSNRLPAPGATEAEWFFAQSLEGYMGFVRQDEVERLAKLDLPDYLLTETTTVTLEGRQLVLPAGAYFHEGPNGKLSLRPGGVELREKLKTVAIGGTVWTAEDILNVTRSMMGTRYLWGAVTSNGIDCSGFCQFIWKSRGVFLPRDAKQQANVGWIVGWGKDVETAAQPGDLIFFKNDVGRISHVGTSLGNGEMIHSGGGGVHVVKLSDRRGRGERSYLDGVHFARRMQGK